MTKYQFFAILQRYYFSVNSLLNKNYGGIKNDDYYETKINYPVSEITQITENRLRAMLRRISELFELWRIYQNRWPGQ